MRISAPNKLVASVMEIKSGPVVSEVIMDVGDQAVTATISTGALDDMKLKQGDQVFAMFNSTVITIIKDTQNEHRDESISWIPRWMDTVLEENYIR
ncbi:TOBE domain-containing protein [Syntrophomonas curvata]